MARIKQAVWYQWLVTARCVSSRRIKYRLASGDAKGFNVPAVCVSFRWLEKTSATWITKKKSANGGWRSGLSAWSHAWPSPRRVFSTTWPQILKKKRNQSYINKCAFIGSATDAKWPLVRQGRLSMLTSYAKGTWQNVGVWRPGLEHVRQYRADDASWPL